MKKSPQLTLFGLPTLLNVFIIVMVISFAVLSYVSAYAVQRTLVRSIDVLTESYELEGEAEVLFHSIHMELHQLSEQLEEGSSMLGLYSDFVKKHPELSYNETEGLLSFALASENQTLEVEWALSPIKQATLLRRNKVQLRMDNNQDYSQDGDPVYGG